jgi:hypothetical protein
MAFDQRNLEPRPRQSERRRGTHHPGADDNGVE